MVSRRSAGSIFLLLVAGLACGGSPSAATAPHSDAGLEARRHTVAGGASELAVRTFIYKVVDGHPLRLDVHSQDTGDGVLRPAIFFMHGGALIMGNRSWLAPGQAEFFTDAGFAFVSVDYRLAPETQLPSIVEDVIDAWGFVERRAESLGVDRARMVAMGASAGGYLALTGGHRFEPPPRAVVSLYGYGELLSAWYTEPSAHYLEDFDRVAESEAWSGVGTDIVSAPAMPTGMADPRARFYLYARQTGRWPELVGGHESQDEAFFAPFEPARHVTSSYPATILLHGGADEDVPIEQSRIMARAFDQHGVEHAFVSDSDWPHGFDMRGLDVTEVAAAYARILAFVRRHLD